MREFDSIKAGLLHELPQIPRGWYLLDRNDIIEVGDKIYDDLFMWINCRQSNFARWPDGLTETVKGCIVIRQIK